MNSLASKAAIGQNSMAAEKLAVLNELSQSQIN